MTCCLIESQADPDLLKQRGGCDRPGAMLSDRIHTCHMTPSAPHQTFHVETALVATNALLVAMGAQRQDEINGI